LSRPQDPASNPDNSSALLMHTAATLYYLEDATQAEIAQRMGKSRPAVSRLLAEARRTGIVRIEVTPLGQPASPEISDKLCKELGLSTVELVPTSSPTMMGRALAPALSKTLLAAGLRPGSVLVLATGRAIYETLQAELPSLPGVVVVPAVGGQDEPEAWYQANELVRQMAEGIGGFPSFLYAPALPGEDLHSSLLTDVSTSHVRELWQRADCAVLGIGAPPAIRQSISAAIPTTSSILQSKAVGDVSLRFFDADGESVPFPGSERLFAIPSEQLKDIPARVALAVGPEKALSIIGAARGGFISHLITDTSTATAILEVLHSDDLND
jgi:DNA-binding transcriptional regulator LsrR (DeoR family)